MIKALIREFPVTDILDDMTEEKIRKYAYTKDEVDALIAEAVAEAKRICLLYTSPSPRDS